jgi:hypothetical protein
VRMKLSMHIRITTHFLFEKFSGPFPFQGCFRIIFYKGDPRVKSLKISFIAQWYSIVITNLHCNHQENLPLLGLVHVATIFPNLHPRSNLVCIHKWSSRVDIINIIVHL